MRLDLHGANGEAPQPSGRKLGWMSATKQRPCPICTSTDQWCRIRADGRIVCCHRKAGGSYKTGTDKNGATIYLHRIADAAVAGIPVGERQQGRTAASVAHRHEVYDFLLDQLPLVEQHRRYLVARGFTHDLIERGKYRSLEIAGLRLGRRLSAKFGEERLRHIPGVTELHIKGNGRMAFSVVRVLGLLIPVRNEVGLIQALHVRKDTVVEGEPRFAWLSSKQCGSGAPAHVPLGTPDTVETVRLTEGATKADVAFARTGIPTLAVAGVDNWARFLPHLSRLKPQIIRLAYDVDWRDKPTVRRALQHLAQELRNRDYLIELEVWDGAKGIDDALANGITMRTIQGEAVFREIGTPLDGGTLPSGEILSRPTIPVTTEEWLVNDQAVAALANDADVYQRDGFLVRVIDDVEEQHQKGIRRPVGPRIEHLPEASLREKLSAVARWVREVGRHDGVVEVPTSPPATCVKAVAARGTWSRIRRLTGVVDYPVFRPDGTIFDTPGYDPATGLLFAPVGQFLRVLERPSLADAVAARDELAEVVGDFPFQTTAHRAAWFSGLLTPLARFAFEGPSPLHAVDANTRGAGKGLLLDCIAAIVTSRSEMVRAAYTHDDAEMRKRITALVMEADRLVLWDNVEGRFGNAALDAALTSTTWKDRILGVSRQYTGQIVASWYATANNLEVGADTARRICHIRLESPHEKPEQRSDVRHPQLRAYVLDSRPRLLRAALTILRAWFVAGKPDMQLVSWGSFEGWSAVVRNVLTWVGLPDPYETRLLLQETADMSALSMTAFLRGLASLDPERRGLTAAEIVEKVRTPPSPAASFYADLRAAIEELVGKLDSRPLGYKLRKYRRRNFDGLFLCQVGTKHKVARWTARPVAEFHLVNQADDADPPNDLAEEPFDCPFA